MWNLTWKNLRANLTRLVSTAVAVITGTAFVACGLVLTGAIANAVAGNTEQQYAAVDAAVTPSTASYEQGPTDLQGVDATLLPTLLELPEVTGAAGELVASAQILDDDGDVIRSQMLGRAWITDEELNPFTVIEGRPPRADGEIAVDRETAADHSVEVGETVDLATPSGRVTADVIGITEFGRSPSVDGGGTVFFAPDTALDVLGAGSEQYSQILLRTDGSTTDLISAVEPQIPANDAVLTGEMFMERATADTQAFVDFLRPVLLGFAFLALFVAGFVIYNTFTVVVTQRSRELALVRSIGGTPAQVRRSLLGEGLLLGFGASVVGLGVGIALSWFLQWILEQLDVGLPSAGFVLSPWTIVITVVAGTLITVISVVIPAFRAGRTRPVEAMRESAVDYSGTSSFRLYLGGGLLLIGIASLLFNRFVSAHPLILGLGALVLFWGVVIGGPLLARLFGRVMRALLSPSLTGRIAAENMVRNPKRTATTANALVIGLFLVTLVTVSGTALRDWTMGELAKISASDFLVVGITPIPDDVVGEISELDGVEQAAAVRSARVTDATGVTAQLSGADVYELVETMGLKATSGSLADVAAGKGAASTGFEQAMAEMQAPSSVPAPSTEPEGSVSTTTPQPSTTIAEQPEEGPRLDIGGSGTSTSTTEVGQVYLLENTQGEIVEVPVAAVLEIQLDTLFLGTLVNEELLTMIAGDQPVSQVYIRADQDRIDELGAELDNLLSDYTGIEAIPGNFIGQILGTIIDFMIAAVNGLLGLSVIIALVGIVNTMNLSIHERRRELGMVRALGMTRSQVRSMVRTEAFAMGILGTVIGVGAGVFCGWVVIGSITDAEIPLAWGRVGVITAVGLVISVLASLWPAHRSTKVEMLEAMAAT
jgi:putative ABC transport system permease protein